MILMNSSVMTISFLIFLLFGSIVAKNFEEINVTSRDELGNTALHEACIFTGNKLLKLIELESYEKFVFFLI